MRNWVEDFDPTENDIHLLTSGPVAPPGLGSTEELGGAYITVSQQGSEREHRQHAAQAITGAAATVGSAPASP
jgi:GTPase-activating protein SST2